MDRQTETLRLYTALQLYCTDWHGKLLLGLGLNDTGKALAFASLAIGAASLFLEQDAKQLKEAGREGCITFTVTTLEEALRALKNEVRQKRSISIGLAGDTAPWLHEMVERGVLPDALATTRHAGEEELHSLEMLRAWGVKPLHANGLVPLTNGSYDMEAQLSQQKLSLQMDVASSMTDRRNRDAQLLTGLPSMEPWFRAAPTLFPRSLDRAYWKTSDSDLSSPS